MLVTCPCKSGWLQTIHPMVWRQGNPAPCARASPQPFRQPALSAPVLLHPRLFRFRALSLWDSQIVPEWTLSPFITMNRVSIKFWSVLFPLLRRRFIRGLLLAKCFILHSFSPQARAILCRSSAQFQGQRHQLPMSRAPVPRSVGISLITKALLPQEVAHECPADLPGIP